jgi:hypothetical protein
MVFCATERGFDFAGPAGRFARVGFIDVDHGLAELRGQVCEAALERVMAEREHRSDRIDRGRKMIEKRWKIIKQLQKSDGPLVFPSDLAH